MHRFVLALACAAMVFLGVCLRRRTFARGLGAKRRARKWPVVACLNYSKSIKKVTPPFVVGFTSPVPVQLAVRICHWFMCVPSPDPHVG